MDTIFSLIFVWISLVRLHMSCKIRFRVLEFWFSLLGSIPFYLKQILFIMISWITTMQPSGPALQKRVLDTWPPDSTKYGLLYFTSNHQSNFFGLPVVKFQPKWSRVTWMSCIPIRLVFTSQDLNMEHSPSGSVIVNKKIELNNYLIFLLVS